MPDQAQLNMLPATTVTGSPKPSTSERMAVLHNLPARLSDEQMTMVEAMATSALPALQRTDERHLAQAMRVLDANMPRRPTDVDSGKLRAGTLEKFFGHMPREQVEFMCRAALTRHSFFPTVAEFTAIAKEWERGDDASRERSLARARLERECELRRREARQRLRYEEVPQAEIDVMPEWLRETLLGDRVLVREGEAIRQSNDWREYQAFVAAQGSEAE